MGMASGGASLTTVSWVSLLSSPRSISRSQTCLAEARAGSISRPMNNPLPRTSRISGLFSERRADRNPVHECELPPFLVSAREVTNAEYARFVEAKGHPAPPHWRGGKIPAGLENHPVSFVSAQDAEAYCAWLTETSGKTVRLLTPDEWQAAASCDCGSHPPVATATSYPWGDDFLKGKANVASGKTAPVGSHPEDRSPCGALDMGGNVCEWTASWEPSPDGEENRKRKKYFLCGGCFDDGADPDLARSANRADMPAGTKMARIGFRTVMQLD